MNSQAYKVSLYSVANTRQNPENQRFRDLALSGHGGEFLDKVDEAAKRAQHVIDEHAKQQDPEVRVSEAKDGPALG